MTKSFSGSVICVPESSGICKWANGYESGTLLTAWVGYHTFQTGCSSQPRVWTVRAGRSVIAEGVEASHRIIKHWLRPQKWSALRFAAPKINGSSLGLLCYTIHSAHGNVRFVASQQARVCMHCLSCRKTWSSSLLPASLSYVSASVPAECFASSHDLFFFFFDFWGRNHKEKHFLFWELRGPAIKLNTYACATRTNITWLHKDEMCMLLIL